MTKDIHTSMKAFLFSTSKIPSSHVPFFLDSCAMRRCPCVLLELSPSQRFQAPLISLGRLAPARPPASCIVAHSSCSLTRSLTHSLSHPFLRPSHTLQFPQVHKTNLNQAPSQLLNLFSHPPLATESGQGCSHRQPAFLTIPSLPVSQLEPLRGVTTTSQPSFLSLDLPDLLVETS